MILFIKAINIAFYNKQADNLIREFIDDMLKCA